MNTTDWIADGQRIASFDEAFEVLSSKQFRQSKDASLDIIPLKAQTLVSLNGEEHLERRRAESGLFRRSQLESYELDVLDQALTERLDQLKASQSPGQSASADLLDIMRLTLMPIASAVIGLDLSNDEDGLRRLASFAAIFGQAFSLEFKLGSIDETRDRALSAVEEFREQMFLGAWKRRRDLLVAHQAGRLQQDDLPNDLIMTLLSSFPHMTETVALRESILFLNASNETTVMAVASSMDHLVSWVANHPEDATHMRDQLFLFRVVCEAVRLHPPPILFRTASKDLTLSTGRSVGEGETVAIDIREANRDPTVFGSDAAEFNPHRTPRHRVKLYGVSFGGGAHMCIGRPLAIGLNSENRDEAALPDESDALGTVIKTLYRLLERGVWVDPDNPPKKRTGWIQDRYERFPISLAGSV